MGNTTTKKIPEIAEHIYRQVINIDEEFNTFINNDTKINRDHICGGVSSGVASSEKYHEDDITVDVWYDISLMELLRGRYQLLEEWIEFINNAKKKNPRKEINLDRYNFSSEEQKEAFIRKYMPLEQDITLADIKAITVIPRDIAFNKRGRYLYKQLKTLFQKHGFENYKEAIDSLTDLALKKKGRCTSGLQTFLKVLGPEYQTNFEKSDPSKKFHITLSLTSSKISQKKMYEKATDALEESVKKEILQPVQFILTNEMKEGDTIALTYGYNLDGNAHLSEFDWVIPQDFLGNYKIGEIITLSDKILPFELGLKLQEIWYPEYQKKKKKLNKPNSLREEYHFSFNITDTENPEDNQLKDEFMDFVSKSINGIVSKSKIHDQAQGFGQYKI